MPVDWIKCHGMGSPDKPVNDMFSKAETPAKRSAEPGPRAAYGALRGERSRVFAALAREFMGSPPDQGQPFILGHGLNAQLLRFLELGARAGTGDEDVGLAGDRTGYLGAQ